MSGFELTPAFLLDSIFFWGFLVFLYKTMRKLLTVRIGVGVDTKIFLWYDYQSNDFCSAEARIESVQPPNPYAFSAPCRAPLISKDCGTMPIWKSSYYSPIAQFKMFWAVAKKDTPLARSSGNAISRTGNRRLRDPTAGEPQLA